MLVNLTYRNAAIIVYVQHYKHLIKTNLSIEAGLPNEFVKFNNLLFGKSLDWKQILAIIFYIFTTILEGIFFCYFLFFAAYVSVQKSV